MNNTTKGAIHFGAGLTGSQAPKANVYNAARFTSPLVSLTNGPRFIILGGQALTGTTGAGGALSSMVYYNNLP